MSGSPSLSPDEVVVRYTVDRADMARRGKIGGYTTHSRYDSRELTQAGRAAFLSKFEREVDPTGVLDEPERRRRPEAAKRAHFARLARLSANARAQRGRAKPTSTSTSPQ
jgi:hypothetical protein